MKISTASILILLIVAATGASLALQSWKARIPTYDTLVDIDNAHEFLVHHQIPDRGVLTSFASYSPPGAAWLMLPGVFMFRDPRLFEYIGSIAIYIGTLIGVFFLADIYFGRQCAELSVILYGLSELGLEVGGSLSQRYPLHFFYVWMVYWTVQWVRRKDARYVAAAIATWAAGLNVFLEIAPAVVILPVVWIYYRPPVRIRPLLIAAVLIGALWYPYLRFEVSRDFVDLRSQVVRQTILPASFEQSWCEPDLAPRNWHRDSTPLNAEAHQASTTPQTTLSKARRFVFGRGGLILDTLQIPKISLVVIPLTLIALGLLCIQGFSRLTLNNTEAETLWSSRLKWLSIIIFLGGLCMNEFIVSHVLSLDGILERSTVSTVRKCELLLMLTGIALMLLKGVIASRLKSLTNRQSEDIKNANAAGVFVISLMIPLTILFCLIEDSASPRGDGFLRMWWLWPVEIVILASVTSYWPLKLGIPRFWTWIGSAILIVFVACNSLVLSRTNSWIRTGWSGSDPEQIRVVDYVAGRVKPDRKKQATIGYDVLITPYWAAFNRADSRYKVGADLDLFFRYRYGILNKNHCAEGTSRDDTYRIVQTRSLSSGFSDHIDLPPDATFHVLHKFDSYQVLQRGGLRPET